MTSVRPEASHDDRLPHVNLRFKLHHERPGLRDTIAFDVRGIAMAAAKLRRTGDAGGTWRAD
jgi:hypothetical protein